MPCPELKVFNNALQQLNIQQQQLWMAIIFAYNLATLEMALEF
jgi:hypothetical protein